MSEDEVQRAYELVRVNGLSYSAAGKQLGGIPKSTIRAAVTREAVRRARVAVASSPPAAPPVPSDDDFVAGLLGKPPAPPPAPVPDRLFVAPPAADGDDDGLDFDAETIIRRQIKKLEALINKLNAEDMVGEAQKHTRTLAGLVHDLRQIEKAKRDDSGVLTYSLEDADAAIRRLDDRARAVEDQHLVCAECGRAMRRRAAET